MKLVVKVQNSVFFKKKTTQPVSSPCCPCPSATICKRSLPSSSITLVVSFLQSICSLMPSTKCEKSWSLLWKYSVVTYKIRSLSYERERKQSREIFAVIAEEAKKIAGKVNNLVKCSHPSFPPTFSLSNQTSVSRHCSVPRRTNASPPGTCCPAWNQDLLFPVPHTTDFWNVISSPAVSALFSLQWWQIPLKIASLPQPQKNAPAREL